MSLIIDSHEDLAWNMLTYGRDYRLPAAETRRREAGQLVYDHNGSTLLGWPDYQRGRVALVFATLFAAPRRFVPPEGWESEIYDDNAGARTCYLKQVDAYQRLVDDSPACFRLVTNRRELELVLQPWEQAEQPSAGEGHPVGLVLLMEGADGIMHPGELESWWQRGLRIIGPVWAGTRYCGGTHLPGRFTPEGFTLLDAMAEQGFTLDISHMSDESVLQAADRYPGRIIASHANIRRLLKDPPNQRCLSDASLKALLERDAVIGVIPYNKFLRADWNRSDDRSLVRLENLADHIDAICQTAGDARHAGIGSDFDGGFGWPDVPLEIDTIADLQKMEPLLAGRGYTPADVDLILGGNWRRFLSAVLP